ncbi:MAG: Na+/H+ antiporter subunit E [Desulfobacteraceae bacterium]
MTGSGGVKASRTAWVRAVLSRSIVLGFSWWVLTEGRSGFSWLGLAGVAAAVLLSMRLMPGAIGRWRFGALARFVPFFLWQSLLGGLDVAQRALRPRLNLRSVVVYHHYGLRQEPARVFFLWVVSLLPGTAGIDLAGDRAAVHVLDSRLADPEKLLKLEKRVAKLFGAPLENTPGG